MENRSNQQPSSRLRPMAIPLTQDFNTYKEQANEKNKSFSQWPPESMKQLANEVLDLYDKAEEIAPDELNKAKCMKNKGILCNKMAEWYLQNEDHYQLDLVIFWCNLAVKNFSAAYSLAAQICKEDWFIGVRMLVTQTWQIVFILSSKIWKQSDRIKFIEAFLSKIDQYQFPQVHVDIKLCVIE